MHFYPWKILQSSSFLNLIFSLTRLRTNYNGAPLLGGLGPAVGLGLVGPVGLGGRGLLRHGGSWEVVGLGGGRGWVGLGVEGGLVGLGGRGGGGGHGKHMDHSL